MFTYRSCAVLTLSLLVAQGIVPSVSASSFSEKEKTSYYSAVETETVKIRRKRRQRNADLSMYIQAPQTSELGDKIEYILFAANGGPSKAQDVKINLSYDSAFLEPIFVQPLGGSGCRIVEASTVVCSFGNMKARTKMSMPLMFRVKANAQCREAIYAKGYIKADKPADLNPSNNVSYAKTLIECAQHPEEVADLSLSIKAPQSVELDEKIQYILFAANGGPSKAQDVKIDFKYDSAFLEPIFDQLGGGGCRIVDSSKISCALGDMPAGTAMDIPLMFRVKEISACKEVFYTKGYIKADKPVDLNQNNNVSYAKTLIECAQHSPEADISLKIINDASTAPGGRLKYMVDLSNAGPNTSSNTKVILSNPSKFLRFNAELSDRRCQEIVFESFAYNSEEDIKDKEVEFLSSSAILCNFGDMEPSTDATASIVFKVSQMAACGSAITNLFESDSDTNDPNSSNNNVYTKAIIECLEF